jgi:hypothetical protein
MFPAGSTRTLTATALLALAAGAPALAQEVSTADIDRMMAVIEAQQRQIDAMRAELTALKAERTAPSSVPAPAPAAVAAAPAATAVPAAAPVDLDDRTEAQMVAEGFTWRDQSGRSLTLSGQVNPAFNVVDDGISTEAVAADVLTFGVVDAEGTSFGLAAVQRIDRFGIDLYSQLRWYELDGTDPDLKNIVVGTFGTKFTF